LTAARFWLLHQEQDYSAIDCTVLYNPIKYHHSFSQHFNLK
jgi:hypothetical protein